MRGFFKVPLEQVVVVHDELDIPYGTVRLKRGGGDNGHNGLRSLTSSLGSRDYLRVRVGIGRPPGRQDPADFVLKDFSGAERKELGFQSTGPPTPSRRCSPDRSSPRRTPSTPTLPEDGAVPAPLAALLVVLSSAAVLVLEVLVSRLVAPYVGLTLETYTAAIGVALGAIAAGAALGGRLADRIDPRRWLGPALAVGGALVLSARPTVFAIGGGFRGLGPVGTVVLVLFAVAPAALVLSMVTPGVVKLRLRTLAETGETVGRLSALGTLGALAGTFLTGFVLLSAFPTSTLLLLTGLLLVVTGLVCTVVLPKVVRPRRCSP